MNAENVAYSKDSMLTRMTLHDSSRRRHIVAFMHCISTCVCVSMLEDKHRFKFGGVISGFYIHLECLRFDLNWWFGLKYVVFLMYSCGVCRFPRRRMKGGFKAKRWKKRRRDRASKEGEKGKEVPKHSGMPKWGLHPIYGVSTPFWRRNICQDGVSTPLMGSPPHFSRIGAAMTGSPPHWRGLHPTNGVSTPFCWEKKPELPILDPFEGPITVGLKQKLKGDA